MGAVKNTAKQKKNKINFVSATIKNITGGVLAYTADYFPGTYSLIENSKEIFEDVKKSQKTSAATVMSTVKTIQKMWSFKTLFDWYADKGGMMDQLEEQNLEFDVGGLDVEGESSSDNKDLVQDSTNAEINAMEKTSDKVAQTVIETSQKQAELQVASLSHITNSLEKTNSIITTGFETVNNSLKDLIKIVTENTASLIKLASIGKEDEESYGGSTRKGISVESLMRGRFNLKDYVKHVKGRISDNGGMILDVAGTIASIFSGDPAMAMDALHSFKKDWIKQGIKWGIEKIAPGISEGFLEAEKSIGKWVSGAILALGKGKNPLTGGRLTGPVWEWIGNVFGVSGRGRGSANVIQLDSLENKKISFDMETKEAIIRVIPGYLRKISTALGNKDEIYNKEKRAFVTKEQLQKEYQEEIYKNYHTDLDQIKGYTHISNNASYKELAEDYEKRGDMYWMTSRIIDSLMVRAAQSSSKDFGDLIKELHLEKAKLDGPIDQCIIPDSIYQYIGTTKNELNSSDPVYVKMKAALVKTLKFIWVMGNNKKMMDQLTRDSYHKMEAHKELNTQMTENNWLENAGLGDVFGDLSDNNALLARERGALTDLGQHKAINDAKIKLLKDKFLSKINRSNNSVTFADENTKELAKSIIETLKEQKKIKTNTWEAVEKYLKDNDSGELDQLKLYDLVNENNFDYINDFEIDEDEIASQFSYENLPADDIRRKMIGDIISNSPKLKNKIIPQINSTTSTPTRSRAPRRMRSSGIGVSFDSALTNFGSTFITPLQNMINTPKVDYTSTLDSFKEDLSFISNNTKKLAEILDGKSKIELKVADLKLPKDGIEIHEKSIAALSKSIGTEITLSLTSAFTFLNQSPENQVSVTASKKKSKKKPFSWFRNLFGRKQKENAIENIESSETEPEESVEIVDYGSKISETVDGIVGTIQDAIGPEITKMSAIVAGGEYTQNKLDENGNVINKQKVKVENGGIIGGIKEGFQKLIPGTEDIVKMTNSVKGLVMQKRPSTAKDPKVRAAEDKAENQKINLITTALGAVAGSSIMGPFGLLLGAMLGATAPISNIGYDIKEVLFGDLLDKESDPKKPKMGFFEKTLVELVAPFKVEAKKTFQHVWMRFRRDVLGPFQDIWAGFKGWIKGGTGKFFSTFFKWWQTTPVAKSLNWFTGKLIGFAKKLPFWGLNLLKFGLVNLLPTSIRGFASTAFGAIGMIPKALRGFFSGIFGDKFRIAMEENKRKRLSGYIDEIKEKGNLIGLDENDKEFQELMGKKEFMNLYKNRPDLTSKAKMEAAINEEKEKWLRNRMTIRSILFGSKAAYTDENPITEMRDKIVSENGGILGFLKGIYEKIVNPNGANEAATVQGENGETILTGEYMELLRSAKDSGYGPNGEKMSDTEFNKLSGLYSKNYHAKQFTGEYKKGEIFSETAADNIADALVSGEITEAKARGLLGKLNNGKTDEQRKANIEIVENAIRMVADREKDKEEQQEENPVIKFFKDAGSFLGKVFGALGKNLPYILALIALLPGMAEAAEKNFGKKLKAETERQDDIINDARSEYMNTFMKVAINEIKKSPEKLKLERMKGIGKQLVEDLLADKNLSPNEIHERMSEYVHRLKTESNMPGFGYKVNAKEMNAIIEEMETTYKTSSGDRFREINKVIEDERAEIKQSQTKIEQLEKNKVEKAKQLSELNELKEKVDIYNRQKADATSKGQKSFDGAKQMRNEIFTKAKALGMDINQSDVIKDFGKKYNDTYTKINNEAIEIDKKLIKENANIINKNEIINKINDRTGSLPKEIVKNIENSVQKEMNNFSIRLTAKMLGGFSAVLLRQCFEGIIIEIYKTANGGRELTRNEQFYIHTGFNIIETVHTGILITSSKSFLERIWVKVISIIQEKFSEKIPNLAKTISEKLGPEFEATMLEKNAQAATAEYIQKIISDNSNKFFNKLATKMETIQMNTGNKIYKAICTQLIKILQSVAWKGGIDLLSATVGNVIGVLVSEAGAAVISGIYGFGNTDRIIGTYKSQSSKKIFNNHKHGFILRFIASTLSAAFNVNSWTMIAEMIADLGLDIARFLSADKLIPADFINVDVISIRQLLCWLIYHWVTPNTKNEDRLTHQLGANTINEINQAKAAGYISSTTRSSQVVSKGIFHGQKNINKDHSIPIKYNKKTIIDSYGKVKKWQKNGDFINDFDQTEEFSNSIFELDSKSGVPIIKYDMSDTSKFSQTKDTIKDLGMNKKILLTLSGDSQFGQENDLIDDPELKHKYIKWRNSINQDIYKILLNIFTSKSKVDLIKQLKDAGILEDSEYYDYNLTNNFDKFLIDITAYTGSKNKDGDKIIDIGKSKYKENLLNVIFEKLNKKKITENKSNIEIIKEFLNKLDHNIYTNSNFKSNEKTYETEEDDISTKYGELIGGPETNLTGSTISNINVPKTGGNGKYANPLGNKPFIITSPYGVDRGYEKHPGVDLAANDGDPYYAISDGIVTDITEGPAGPGYGGHGYGYYVSIKDPISGLNYLYGHMQSPTKLKRGDKVQKGKTLIGYAGNTGFSRGTHLHFEVRKGKKNSNDDWFQSPTINPMPILENQDKTISYDNPDNPSITRMDSSSNIYSDDINNTNNQSTNSINSFLSSFLGLDILDKAINQILSPFSNQNTSTSNTNQSLSNNTIDQQKGIITNTPYTGKYKYITLPEGYKAPLISEDQKKTALIAYDTLRKHGFNHIAASAILGNLMQESSMNPDIDGPVVVDKKTGQRDTAKGLAQWIWGRKTALFEYAKKQGKPYTDPALQMDFLVKEIGEGQVYGPGTSPYKIDDLNKMDLRNVTSTWMKGFERCDVTEEALNNRNIYAQYFNNAIGEGGPIPFLKLNDIKNINKNFSKIGINFDKNVASKLTSLPKMINISDKISTPENFINLFQTQTKETKNDQLSQIANLLIQLITAVEAGNALKGSELKSKLTDMTKANNLLKDFESNLKKRTNKFKAAPPFNSPFPHQISSLIFGS